MIANVSSERLLARRHHKAELAHDLAHPLVYDTVVKAIVRAVAVPEVRIPAGKRRVVESQNVMPCRLHQGVGDCVEFISDLSNCAARSMITPRAMYIHPTRRREVLRRGLTPEQP